jgi:hypothetical protein
LDPSCVDEVRCYAMSGFEQHLGLCMWEDPIRDAAWRYGALFVSHGGGETSLVQFGCIWGLGKHRCVVYGGSPPSWKGLRTNLVVWSPWSGMGRCPPRWGRVSLWSPP